MDFPFTLSAALRSLDFDERALRNEPHARCRQAYLALPWNEADERIQSSIRACLAMATSLIELAPDCCSLRQDIERAFSARTDNNIPDIELAMSIMASRYELDARLSLPRPESLRSMIELAPAFFGGPRWFECPRLSRAARMGFVHAAATSSASRLFSNAHPPSSVGLARHAERLELLAHADWPPLSDAQELASFEQRLGEPEAWPISVAARERIAIIEKAELQTECARPQPRPSRPSRL